VIYHHPEDPKQFLLQKLEELQQNLNRNTGLQSTPSIIIHTTTTEPSTPTVQRRQSNLVPILHLPTSDHHNNNTLQISESDDDGQQVLSAPPREFVKSKSMTSVPNALTFDTQLNKDRRRSLDLGQLSHTATKETHQVRINKTKEGVKMINQYIVGNSIGKGTYGTVKLATDCTTGLRYVCMFYCTIANIICTGSQNI
jgi:hypothetical protein